MEGNQSESDLLERVFLRLGHVNNDEKLEEFAKKFVTPVLLKLSSHDEGVKKKVLELLAHINRRLKSRQCVQLPMESLLLQYQDPLCTPYVRNFTILYLKMGFSRLPPDKQLQYMPQVFLCMLDKPKPQQECLLQLVIPTLLIIPSDNLSAMKEIHSILSKDKAILDSFLTFVLDILLLPYNAFSSKETFENMVIPRGLSRSVYQKILTGCTSLSLENLEKVKLGILRFLSADLFESSSVQVHLVVATGDSRHGVSGYAEHQLKRITEASDWEHTGVVTKLMSIYLGTINLPGKKPVPPDEVRSAATLPLRLKIFPFLLKSRKSADAFPACLQLVFQSLHGEVKDKKLKMFSVKFIHHLCECSSDKVMAVISSVLLSTLMKLTNSEEQESNLRKIMFLAIGKISKRSPNLFQKDSGVAQSLFDALLREDTETGLTIMQALTMVATASKGAPEATLSLIEALVLDNISREHPHCRLAALQVANILFPTSHVKSRYACLVASADITDSVKEEANLGLLSSKDLPDTSSKARLPDFCEMVSYIHQTVYGVNGYTQAYSTVAGGLLYSPETFIKVLQYLRRCLKSSAGVTKDDEDNDQTMVPISRYIQVILCSKSPVVFQYLSLIQEALKPAGSYELHYVALVGLLELLASAPGKLSPELIKPGTSWIKNFIWSSHDLIRHTSSHVLAILACLSGKEIVLQEIKQLLGTLGDSTEAVRHGTLICCGHLIGQYMEQQNHDHCHEMKVEDMELGPGELDAQIEEVISKTFQAIVKFLVSPSSLLVHAACDAVGEVCRQGSMPLPDGTLGDEDKTSEANVAKNIAKPLTKLDIVHLLVGIMNTSKESKLREKAALTLGLLCVGDKNFPHHKIAIEKLLEASKNREIDLQFTVGEALSCAGAGKFSTASRSKWFTAGIVVEELAESKETMAWLLLTIMNEYIGSDIDYVRKAACIWLLVLLKHTSKHSVVQEMMGEIQQAFSSMLSENDEIVQEVASKGLSLVYEFGSEKFRKNMVSSLVDAMLSGKKPVRNVTAGTKLFDKGALGKAPGDTGQLTTYKELCSLASDMNQPELVYRFLHLANHNAMWNSKKGAAFGFASIGAQAKKELEPHLKTLVPKLYRYQFDPNSKVREAMLSIWSAIVKDQRKVIDQYSKEILTELLANLHNPVWRVRQSCCIAVGNFLNGRPLDTVIEYLPQLWTMCLRDMDDIKESVRQAAQVACKTLQTVSIRLCDVNQGKVAQEAVRVILPVLLEQGLGTKVDEVRNLGLDTIVKISKNAGNLLKPHIPVLVVALLESLSGLEPQKLNYLSFHIQKDEDLQDKLDDIRIAASKSSPMMETITLCVQQIDGTVLPGLIPHLTDLLRRGLGLGTKAGCASLVVSLVQQCGLELQPYAGKLLSALLAGMTDRSLAVRRKYADGIGHVARVAKGSSVSKLFAKMKAWYLEKEGTAQDSSGLVCRAIARSAPDVLTHHAATILPLAFVARHQKSDKDDKKSLWEEIWSENTSGATKGIQLYLEEIISISTTMLCSQSWERKVEAALSLQTVVNTLNTALPKKHLDELAGALVSSLSGRTWDGKESLVACLTTLWSKCHISLDETSKREITAAVLKECRKEKPSYKADAIKCLGQILQINKCQTCDFEDVFDILKPIVNPEDEEQSPMECDDEQVPSSQLVISAFECLGLAWPVERKQQVEYRDKVLSILTEALKKHPWKIQLAVLDSLKLYIKAISSGDVSSEEDYHFMDSVVSGVLSELFPCLGNIKYAAIRVKSLEVVKCIVSILEMGEFSKMIQEQAGLMKELTIQLGILRTDNNTTVKDKAIQLETIVKRLALNLVHDS